MRKPARWLREAGQAGLDEDWTLVLLGVTVLIVTLGLAVFAAWTVHQRDAALQNATAAGQRLDVKGPDDRLYQDLIALQQDEVTLFQAHEDPSQARPGQVPSAALAQVQADLATLKAQFGGSARVQSDISLISQEMPVYTGLEASALSFNQQGLPVGAAYLREASGYLTGHTLPTADDIRQADQAQVIADDAAAGALPWPLLAVAVAGLACLVSVQILVARYTRCQFDLWLLLSAGVTIVVLVWSVAALSVSLGDVGGSTSPHAAEAKALAQAWVDGIQAHGDDLLTQADHGEDCSANGAVVTCSFETQVVGYLTAPGGTLRQDLARASADATDQAARLSLAAATTAADQWLNDEQSLPTLQNLAKAGRDKGSGDPRYNPAFEKSLNQYTDPATATYPVFGDFTTFQGAVTSAIRSEWISYGQQAAVAGGALSGAVTGAVLLGLLAAGLGGAGIGLRVAEYWSAGGQGQAV